MNIKINWLVYLSSLTATLSILSCGIQYSWSSPALPKLEREMNIILGNSERTLLVSIMFVSSMVTALFSPMIVDLMGRKLTIFYSIPLYFTAWILVATGESYYMLLLARAIGGVADTTVYTVIPMYLGEIAETSIRGLLTSSIQVFLISGMLVENTLGPILSIRLMAYGAACISLVQLSLIYFLPESPYFLIAKGKYDKAMKVLKKMRKYQSDEKVTAEFDSIIATVQKEQTTGGCKSLVSEYQAIFTDKINMKALIICICLRSLQQMSGISIIAFYTQEIFEASSSQISSQLSATIYVVLMLISTIVSSCVSDVVGRKPLYIFSSVGSCTCLLSVSVFFFLKSHEEYSHLTETFYLVPVIGLLAYVVFFNLGQGPVPITILSEIFPTQFKSKSLAFMDFIFSFIVIIVTFISNAVADSFGFGAMFLMFTVGCILATVYGVYFLPETKGKSLEEIQCWLRGEQIEQKEKNVDDLIHKKNCKSYDVSVCSL